MAPEDLLDLIEMEQPGGHVFVVDTVFEQIFGRVAKRRVPDIVQQSCGADEPALRALRVRLENLRILRRQRIVDLAGQLHRPENVAEAAVLGAGINEVRKAELMDRSQPLQRSAVDQRLLEPICVDEAVDGVTVRGD